jgi:hypothetical protein
MVPFHLFRLIVGRDIPHTVADLTCTRIVRVTEESRHLYIDTSSNVFGRPSLPSANDDAK